MVSTIDLASLSTETREDLAKLIEPESPIDDGQAPQGDQGTKTEAELEAEKVAATEKVRPRKPSEPPAYVRTIMEQNAALQKGLETLTESYRVTQGQVRAMESRLVQTGQAREREVTSVSDSLADLDMSDPSIAALAKQVKEQRAEITSMKTAQQQAALAAQEQAQREQWFGYLDRNIAAELGVNFAEVLPQLKDVPTDGLAIQGAKLITAAAKAKNTPASEADIEGRIAKAVATAKQELLKQFGVWDDVVRGVSTGSADDAQFLLDYSAGKSQDHKRAEKLLKGLT